MTFRPPETEISFDNAEALKRAGIDYITHATDGAIFDLGGLERANSMTVAVMIAWYRAARLKTQSIVFQNLSHDLRNIIAFSGLSAILEGEPADG